MSAFKTAKALLKLLRPLNAVMTAIAVWVGFALSIKAFEINALVALLIISAFLISGAGQAINDYFDRKIDERIKPKRPIPSKSVSAKSALVYSLVLFVIGIVLAALVNVIALAIAIVFSLLYIAYSSVLKNAKFLGNWIVAAGTGFAFVFGATISGNYFLVSIIAGIAVLSNAAREIVKDIEDFENGEREKKSLARIAGKKASKNFAAVIAIIAVGLSYAPFFLQLITNPYYLAIVTVANIIMLSAAIFGIKGLFEKSQKQFKIGMLIALIAFIAGIL